MQKCGLCSIITGLFRRAMCIGSRRNSSESYYRELGDQDTLKIEDKSSDLSDDEKLAHEELASGSSSAQQSADGAEPASTPPPAQQPLDPGCFHTLQKRRKKPLVTRSLVTEAALLDDLHMGQVQCILNQSAQWRFNAFALQTVSGGRCLPVLCLHLFHVYGLLTHFKLDAVKAWKLFSLIEEGYHSTNPYHNSIHAADVTQAMHCFLQQKQIRDHLEPLEIMASLLAAIAHDMDHPGVNQPFLIATSNHLAALYRNTSVLENHHWRSAISCIIESGLLDQMSNMRKKLEFQISSLILATDITRQQEYLSQFKNHMHMKTLDMKNEKHRHLVLQIALKCADISNPCRPWDISRKWSLKVCEEFFRQGDYERRLNLPVTALCDRYTTSIPKIQTGFFKFVVTPLITEWHKFLQNDLSAQMLSNLLYNQNMWETLMAQELAEESGTEITDADMVDDDLDTGSGTNISDSSELLLPVRRSSLNPVKQVGFKEQLRRFSVPLNMFQDSKFRGRDRPKASSADPQCHSSTHSFKGSEHSLHSHRSAQGQSEQARGAAAKALSTEKLLPDSSIASITTPVQATRLSTVLKDGGTWKLIRQQTFPPLEMAERAHSMRNRPSLGFDDVMMPSRFRETGFKDGNCKKDGGKISNVFTRNDNEKTDNDGASQNSNVDVTEPPKGLEKSPSVSPSSSHLEPLVCVVGAAGAVRRESAGSQLRDNLTAVQLGAHAAVDQLHRRRKSMPADTIAYMPKEKKVREVTTTVLPQFLRRTPSGREVWSGRRGSAPPPVPARRKPPAAPAPTAAPAPSPRPLPRVALAAAPAAAAAPQLATSRGAYRYISDLKQKSRSSSKYTQRNNAGFMLKLYIPGCSEIFPCRVYR